MLQYTRTSILLSSILLSSILLSSFNKLVKEFLVLDTSIVKKYEKYLTLSSIS